LEGTRLAKETPDDLEVVRTFVAALQPFEPKDQERIIRWVREKLGLAAPATGASDKAPADEKELPGKPTDIKAFIDLKSPQSDIHFAAAVAYYYRSPQNILITC
jgi:hypothetical protein